MGDSLSNVHAHMLSQGWQSTALVQGWACKRKGAAGPGRMPVSCKSYVDTV
jgi:hypothetical protein